MVATGLCAGVRRREWRRWVRVRLVVGRCVCRTGRAAHEASRPFFRGGRIYHRARLIGGSSSCTDPRPNYRQPPDGSQQVWRDSFPPLLRQDLGLLLSACWRPHAGLVTLRHGFRPTEDSWAIETAHSIARFKHGQHSAFIPKTDPAARPLDYPAEITRRSTEQE
jgi:hypothetical protein